MKDGLLVLVASLVVARLVKSLFHLGPNPRVVVVMGVEPAGKSNSLAESLGQEFTWYALSVPTGFTKTECQEQIPPANNATHRISLSPRTGFEVEEVASTKAKVWVEARAAAKVKTRDKKMHIQSPSTKLGSSRPWRRPRPW